MFLTTIFIPFCRNYQSAFQDTLKAFTKNPLWDLKTSRGKNVCFKNIVYVLWVHSTFTQNDIRALL